MDPDHSDAASLARELLPRLRRWDSASWLVPAELRSTGGSPAPAPAARRDPAGRRHSAGRRHWVGRPAAGQARATGGGPTRAEVAAATVQRLADAAADAEGQQRRPVPLLADVNLPDQLTVMVDDILRTGDPTALRTAATELAALRAALGYR
jgi:hypothetical protein